MKRALSRLSTKLAALYLLLFLCIFIPTILIYCYVTLSNIKEDIQLEFESTELVFHQFIRIRTEQARESVLLLTQDFGFREAVATRDVNTIESAIENLENRINVDWALVVNADGVVISGARDRLENSPAIARLIAHADERGIAADMGIVDGAVQQLIAAPVNAPELLGWAVFGFDLNVSELQSLSDKSSTPFDAIILYTENNGAWEQIALTTDAVLSEATFQSTLRYAKNVGTNILELAEKGEEQLLLVGALPVVEADSPMFLVLRVHLGEALVRFEGLFFMLMLIGGFGVGLLTLGSWILSLNVTRPLTELAFAADQVGQGKFAIINFRARSDEIGHLASRFNTMAEEIQARADQLQGMNASLEMRVAERSRKLSETNVKLLQEIERRNLSEQDLLEAKLKAESANSAKDDFLATMSHELRTPMNGIMGIIYYLKNADLPDDCMNNIGILEDSADSLLAILNDILDFAKIDSGKIEIHQEAFSLQYLIDGIEDLWRVAADDKGLKFNVISEIDENDRLIGDKARIRQIINNYLNNAIKFTKGSLTLSVSYIKATDDEIEVRFCVSDNGPGIHAEEVPNLFQKFSQLEEGKARRFGGTGLGLVICRRLAAVMGGEVGVDSEFGKGATFWCVLPFKRAKIVEAVRASDHCAPNLTAVKRDAGDNLRILVVEDNEINIRVVTLFIEQLGYYVADVARDGVQAVDKILGGGPWDVVLMDLRMPNMDGLEATRRVRSAGFGTQTLPIIALTADATESEKEACKQAGMTDFVSKPVSAKELLRALQNAAGTDSDRIVSVA